MINQQFNNNMCIICSVININRNINTKLLTVNYKKTSFYCHKDCKTKLLYYLDLLLKNQDLDFNIDDLHFSEYKKNTNDNINIINKQEYKMEKYKQFMINYDIHSFSENIKNINLTNEDNNNLSNLLFNISLWF